MDSFTPAEEPSVVFLLICDNKSGRPLRKNLRKIAHHVANQINCRGAGEEEGVAEAKQKHAYLCVNFESFRLNP